MRTELNNEHDIRKHVSLLKNFYGEFTAYVVVCIVAILVWVLQDFGYFWPRWIIVIWGASLILKSSKLEIIDRKFYKFFHGLRDRLPFMQKGWEDLKIKELMESTGLKKVNASSNFNPAVKKEVNQSTQSSNNAAKNSAHTVKPAATKVEQKVAPKPTVKAPVVKKPAADAKPPIKKPTINKSSKQGANSGNKAKPKAPAAPTKK